MKGIFYTSIIICLLLSAVGCKKKSAETNLNGTWELSSVNGGQVAGVSPNIESGKGNLLKFSGQNYEKYIEGKLVSSGTFSLKKEAEVAVNKNKANYSILFGDEKLLVNLSAKQLIVFDGVIAADGFESIYKKQ